MRAWIWAVLLQSTVASWEPMGGLWSFDPEAPVDRAPARSADRHGIEMMSVPVSVLNNTP